VDGLNKCNFKRKIQFGLILEVVTVVVVVVVVVDVVDV
jgi:hypothetical protein